MWLLNLKIRLSGVGFKFRVQGYDVPLHFCNDLLWSCHKGGLVQGSRFKDPVATRVQYTGLHTACRV